MLPVENWNEAAVMTAITETHEDHAQTLINKIKENLGADTITSDMVANWLTAHGFVIDTTTDLSTIDPRALITVVTRPVLTDIVENFSELTLSKYITSEEILDQEVINFLKDKILMVLNSAPFKEALEIKLYRSNWFDDAQAYQITISPNAWNKLIAVLTTGLDNNQTIDQIVENIITDGFLDFLLKENTELADVLEETPEHLEELKNILATWIRSADSTGLYEQSITKESRFNPLFDVLR